ncbi:uncharacterized protein LOC108736733 [Agrilus planipennis]|uniref:Uncharacterized protein LOC108736733 n=1 Tax=Agrilus planipennis TaxID=224129 RepID=A0A1W4WXJ9_AGRPL|nr:uncharacterized protein LOC108736733 [Agrilus planipennis]
MDALLIFDVLMYVNLYYFPVFSFCNIMMLLAKYLSKKYPTPYIGTDALVQLGLLVSELLKIFLFKRLREQHKGWSVFVAVIFVATSICGLVYVFLLQTPVLKLEYILDAMMSFLLLSEFLYGIFSFMPCCKKHEFT